MLTALKSRVSFARHEASAALAKIGSAAAKYPQALPALIRALSDYDYEVRINAATALGAFGPTALPALTKALDDSDEDVRQAVEAAIKKIEAEK